MGNRNLKASVIIGGAVSGSFRSAMSSAQNGLKAIGAEIARVEARQRDFGRLIQDLGRNGSRSIDHLRQRYALLTAQAEKLKRAQAALARANERVELNQSRRVEIGGQLRNATVTFGVVATATVTPIRAAAEFETRMLGVAKQLQGARDAAGNLTPEYFGMVRQVQNLGRELPIATKQIADMVAAGLRMGVAKNEVIGFTRTAAMMADAFELPAGQLADDMGKIAGLFHIPIPRIGELADAINYLDDNAQSSGGEIIDVMRRIGGMAQTLKMPAKEAAALGSTFLSLGSTAEVAGTASNAVMQILGAATAKSKRVRVGLASIGFDPEDVQASMAKDATDTILKLLDKLNSLPSEQRMVAASRIFGAEYGDDIAKLASGADEYRRQLALVNGEQQKGSMSREFQARLKTTGAQWQIAKNRMMGVAVAIGDALLPAVNDLLKSAAPAIDGFAEWSREHPGFIKGVVGSALALSGLKVAALGVRYAWTALASPFLKVGELMAKFRAAKEIAAAGGQVGRIASIALRIGSIVRTVGAVIAGVAGGPIAAAVAAITIGALVVRKYWEPISAWIGGVAQGVGGAFKQAFGELGAALAPLRPAWDAISAAAGQFFGWIGRLLAPVHMTGEELKGATDSGRTFGVVLGAVLTNGIRTITAFVKAVAWIGSAVGSAWSLAKSVVGSAVDWIMGRIAPLVRTGAAVAGALGFGGATLAPASATGSTPLRRPPGRVPTALRAATASATSRARSGSSPAARASAPVTVQGDNVAIHVTQQPGESSEALAERIGAVLDRRRETRLRGALADDAG